MIDLRQGDCLEVMRTLPDESVHCIVTSPPYWSLRDYGTPPVVFGGDPDCGHDWTSHVKPAANGLVNNVMQGDTLSGTSATRKPTTSDYCAKCGAWRGQLGLEPTFAEFLAHMVEIFEECRRVLRNDGTCWVNMGDSYSSGGGADTNGNRGNPHSRDARQRIGELPAKNLIGQPWRLAFALQDTGWILRSDIIWHKPNPMPESVTDRCTKAHEYIFLLTKSAKYWYDADALREPHSTTVYRNTSQTDEYAHGFTPEQVAGRKVQRGGKALAYAYADGVPGHPLGRNARTVWTIPTNGYPDAHFATFPEDLPKRCILAGCPEGGTVLDIFAGSGTTLAVAVRLGRNAIGIELNPEYIELARQRIAAETPSLFAQEGL